MPGHPPGASFPCLGPPPPPCPHTWLWLPAVSPAQGGPCLDPHFPSQKTQAALTTCGGWVGVQVQAAYLQAAWKWGAALSLPRSPLGGPGSPVVPSGLPKPLFGFSVSSAGVGLNGSSRFPVERVSKLAGEGRPWVPPASGLSLACGPWGPLLLRSRAPGSCLLSHCPRPCHTGRAFGLIFSPPPSEILLLPLGSDPSFCHQCRDPLQTHV